MKPGAQYAIALGIAWLLMLAVLAPLFRRRGLPSKRD